MVPFNIRNKKRGRKPPTSKLSNQTIIEDKTMPDKKVRKARLDADKTAKPLTSISALVKEGKKNWGDNVVGYVVRDVDPNDNNTR